MNKPKSGGNKSPVGFTPYIVEERSQNMSILDVFSRLMMDRIIFLGTEIDDDVANTVNAQLLFMEQQSDTDPIWLYINSPGGSCYSGLAIYDTMNFIKAPIYTCVMGLAASMAYVLAISGEKGHRMALPHSRLMQHQPLGGTWGQATDIAIYHAEMTKIKDDLYKIISARTGQDIGKVREDCERDNWMRATEAVEYGAIDKVIGTTELPKSEKKTKKRNINK